MLAAALGQRLVNVRRAGPRSAPLVVLELRRRLEVGLLAGRRGGGRGGLVDAEGELHAMNGSGPAVLIRFAFALLLGSALLEELSRVIPLEAGGLELLNTPTR